MSASQISDRVRGKTVRLSWTEGPTKGTTQAHHFFADGTVEWHSDESGKDATQAHAKGDEANKKPERPAYMGVDVDKNVCIVSYLSKSGYTLTVALNFADSSILGVASNEKTWFPVRGTFELAE